MSTPKELERCYLCLWGIKLQSDHPMKFEAGVPSSSLILADYNTINIHVLMSRFNARGCVVPGSGNRSGKQKDVDTPQCNRGGWRYCKTYKGPGFIHEDAKSALEKAISKSDQICVGTETNVIKTAIVNVGIDSNDEDFV
eukprot:581962-Ditylum_brightwellii.AAC.1